MTEIPVMPLRLQSANGRSTRWGVVDSQSQISWYWIYQLKKNFLDSFCNCFNTELRLETHLAHPPLHANLSCLFLVPLTCGHTSPHLQLFASFFCIQTALFPSSSTLLLQLPLYPPVDCCLLFCCFCLLALHLPSDCVECFMWIFLCSCTQRLVCCFTRFGFCLYQFGRLIIPLRNLFLCWLFGLSLVPFLSLILLNFPILIFNLFTNLAYLISVCIGVQGWRSRYSVYYRDVPICGVSLLILISVLLLTYHHTIPCSKHRTLVDEKWYKSLLHLPQLKGKQQCNDGGQQPKMIYSSRY